MCRKKCKSKAINTSTILLQGRAQFNVMSMVKGQGGESFKTYSLPYNVPCYLMVGHEA